MGQLTAENRNWLGGDLDSVTEGDECNHLFLDNRCITRALCPLGGPYRAIHAGPARNDGFYLLLLAVTVGVSAGAFADSDSAIGRTSPCRW